MTILEMLNSHPKVQGRSADALYHCIEQCVTCAQLCKICADACLSEGRVADLVQCIRLDLDCADICSATGSAAARLSGTNMAVVHQLISTCAEACRACEAECRKHAEMHEHCRICADGCKRCEASCVDALPLVH